jgi:predicted phage tail protein
MTSINLHGILAKEFGSGFYLKIRKPKEVISAVSANKPKFHQRILELAKEGFNYAIIIDGENIKNKNQLEIGKEPETIDLVPMICGGGPVNAFFTWVFTTIGVSAANIATFASVATTAFYTAASIAVQYALTDAVKQEAVESTLSATNQSFAFSSKANRMEQGNPVPVGYGRLRVGSSVIQITIKNYPQKFDAQSALVSNLNDNNIATVFKS